MSGATSKLGSCLASDPPSSTRISLSLTETVSLLLAPPRSEMKLLWSTLCGTLLSASIASMRSTMRSHFCMRSASSSAALFARKFSQILPTTSSTYSSSGMSFPSIRLSRIFSPTARRRPSCSGLLTRPVSSSLRGLRADSGSLTGAFTHFSASSIMSFRIITFRL